MCTISDIVKNLLTFKDIETQEHFMEGNTREACLCKNRFNFKVDCNMKKQNKIVSNKCPVAHNYATPTWWM